MYNNNKFFTSLLMAGGLLVAAGCSKSIDKTPISTITASNFYKTASDAEAGLTGAYNALYQQYYIWDYMTNGDAQSDNCYAGGNNADNFAIDNFSLNALNGNITRDWQGLYAGVVTANAVIDNVPGITAQAWSGNTRKQQIIGEAKFLRALHYFNLVTTYGKAPLVITNTGTGDALSPSRAAVADVYAQIERDL
ncbi:MAG TPA: RagB/SusD family nutrient uptake outer membrane protein, partial [Puia sp.]|nr:RagB/SusD family nutrient uptake outer membrane protein [Puia sp.]